MAKNNLSESGLTSNHVKDLRGKRFGNVVVESQHHSEGSKSFWNCRCDCGNEVILTTTQLRVNHCPSCGCVPRFANRPNRLNVKTHHKTGTRLYSIWKSMRQRCSANPNNPNYERYSGRGIKVCDEWQKFEPFQDWALANGYDENAPFMKCTLDRINNDGDYEPSNCRWADNATQQRNRRKTVKLSYKGETKALTEWCERFGLNIKTCYNRLHTYGWTNPQDILFGKGGTEQCPRIY